MQTVKTLSLIFLSAALLGACGLRGPLYLPDEDPSTSTATDLEQDSPLNLDSTENIQVKKDKKKKDTF